MSLVTSLTEEPCHGFQCEEMLPADRNPRRIYCSSKCGIRTAAKRTQLVKRSMPDYRIGKSSVCSNPSCGRTFQIRIHNQLYCSKDCYRAAQSQLPIPDKCRFCSGEIPEGRRRNKRTRYCSTECSVNGKRAFRKQREITRKSASVIEVDLMACELCEQIIPRHSRDHRFCKSCRVINQKARTLQVDSSNAYRVWFAVLCAACGEPFAEDSGKGSESPVLDHDHVTGKVRGKIHSRCNLAIGMAGDNPKRLMSLALYLLEDWSRA